MIAKDSLSAKDFPLISGESFAIMPGAGRAADAIGPILLSCSVPVTEMPHREPSPSGGTNTPREIGRAQPVRWEQRGNSAFLSYCAGGKTMNISYLVYQ